MITRDLNLSHPTFYSNPSSVTLLQCLFFLTAKPLVRNVDLTLSSAVSERLFAFTTVLGCFIFIYVVYLFSTIKNKLQL